MLSARPSAFPSVHQAEPSPDTYRSVHTVNTYRFSTGQAYVSSSTACSYIVASASQIELVEGNRWLLKGEEKKNGRSGRRGWGERRE